jgi:hypothetical protein
MEGLAGRCRLAKPSRHLFDETGWTRATHNIWKAKAELLHRTITINPLILASGKNDWWYEGKDMRFECRAGRSERARRVLG